MVNKHSLVTIAALVVSSIGGVAALDDGTRYVYKPTCVEKIEDFQTANYKDEPQFEFDHLAFEVVADNQARTECTYIDTSNNNTSRYFAAEIAVLLGGQPVGANKWPAPSSAAK
ncbi:uncharacterized protein L201_005187 [Kwoniella dendrophila CBS 6074]|uniref:DUF3757 domain-containing protein n=1 Tax=Kwoniella dendrophila CBS 6074 TaxID=1295534 RepID=A0AAX4JYI7_9TREE